MRWWALVILVTPLACNALSGADSYVVGDDEEGVVSPDASSPVFDGAPPPDGRAPFVPPSPPLDASFDADPLDAGVAADGEAGTTGKRVFVTSTAYQGKLGGLASADALCAGAASSAGLGGTWVAWLSTTQIGALSRVSGQGPWRLVTGPIAVASKAELTTELTHAIDRDENGSLVDAKAWTGTSASGQSGSGTCMAWSVGTFYPGVVGSTTATKAGGSPSWTNEPARPCSESHHLYCFEK